MKKSYKTNVKDVIELELETSESVIVTNPDLIMAFSCAGIVEEKRIDFIVGGKEIIYSAVSKRKRLINSKVNGACKIMIKSRNHGEIAFVEISEGDVLTFVERELILFYTTGIQIKPIRNNINILKDRDFLFTYECTGNGIIAFQSEGSILEYSVADGEVAFFPKDLLICHVSKSSKGFVPKIAYYGNDIAVQTMPANLAFEGPVNIILKTQSLSKDLENTIRNDRSIKSYLIDTLNNVLPGPLKIPN